MISFRGLNRRICKSEHNVPLIIHVNLDKNINKRLRYNIVASTFCNASHITVLSSNSNNYLKSAGEHLQGLAKSLSCSAKRNLVSKHNEQSSKMGNYDSRVPNRGAWTNVTYKIPHSPLALSRHSLNGMPNIRQFSSATNIDIPTLELTGIWKTLSESVAVEFAQSSIVWLHSTTGLSWWVTIMLVTFTARAFITLPLAFYQIKILSKVENLSVEMNELVKELKAETNFAVRKYGWTETYARAMYNRSLKKEWNDLIVRDNCHPLKSIVVVLAQIPLWVILSTALRNLCFLLPYRDIDSQIAYLELTVGGFGWVSNLTSVDHFFILPITLGLLNLAIVEIQYMNRKDGTSTKVHKYMTNFFRVVSIGMVPLAAYVPSCIALYWVSSSAFGVFQNLLVLSPRVRRLVGIPRTETERAQPYTYLVGKIKDRVQGSRDSQKCTEKA